MLIVYLSEFAGRLASLPVILGYQTLRRLERTEAELNDYSSIHTRALNSLLYDMTQSFFEKFPVDADPIRYLVHFDNLNLWFRICVK